MLLNRIWRDESESIWKLVTTYAHRRWAGKTSHVHLAPEHVFTIKHLRGTE